MLLHQLKPMLDILWVESLSTLGVKSLAPMSGQSLLGDVLKSSQASSLRQDRSQQNLVVQSELSLHGL